MVYDRSHSSGENRKKKSLNQRTNCQPRFWWANGIGFKSNARGEKSQIAESRRSAPRNPSWCSKKSFRFFWRSLWCFVIFLFSFACFVGVDSEGIGFEFGRKVPTGRADNVNICRQFTSEYIIKCDAYPLIIAGGGGDGDDDAWRQIFAESCITRKC